MGESSSNTDIVKQIQNSGLENNLKDFKGILEKDDIQKVNFRENEVEIIESIQESNNSVNKSADTESSTSLIKPEDKLSESQEVLDLKDLKGKISQEDFFQVKPNQSSILVILLLTLIQIFLINQLIYLLRLTT